MKEVIFTAPVCMHFKLFSTIVSEQMTISYIIHILFIPSLWRFGSFEVSLWLDIIYNLMSDRQKID